MIREPFASASAAVIDPADIAAVAAAVLRSPAAHVGQTYCLSGPESLLPAERLQILGQVLGRDLHLQAQTESEAREQMNREMPGAYIDAFFDFYVGGSLDESQVYPAVEQILGRPARAFEQWARSTKREFR